MITPLLGNVAFVVGVALVAIGIGNRTAIIVTGVVLIVLGILVR